MVDHSPTLIDLMHTLLSHHVTQQALNLDSRSDLCRCLTTQEHSDRPAHGSMTLLENACTDDPSDT